MFNQNVAITLGETTYGYGLLSVIEQNSRRGNASASIGTPDVFSISHETKGKGASAVDRHLVRVDTTYEAVGSNGESFLATASAYVVLVVPHSVVTKANVKLAYDKVVAFLASTESGASETNLARVLNGEP